MSLLKTVPSGYLCTPYSHDHNSVDLKNSWLDSSNVHDIYFVTATFSNEVKSYFPLLSNHYLLAKFDDHTIALNSLKKHIQDITSFIFTIDDRMFSKHSDEINFVSVYYLEYGNSNDDLKELHQTITRHDHIDQMIIGSMSTFSSQPSKFDFPFTNNIVVLEVSSNKSHQSINKYCEEMRRYVNRKGMTLNNIVALSILEKLK